MGQDRIIIEAKGEKIEIPLHMTTIELCKNWGAKRAGPELVIKAIARNEEETKKWAEIYEKICWQTEGND